MPGHQSLATLMLALTLSISACSQNETAPKYQVEEEADWTEITAQHFNVEPAVFEREGVHTLTPEPTQGQFPAAICIVRVEAIGQGDNRHQLRLLPLPSQHAIYWNHLFDGLPAVREVVFLGTPGLDPRGTQLNEILSASLANACELCLIYARDEFTDADAEHVGILWNTRTRTALASVRAPVVLPIEVAKEYKETPDSDRSIVEADFRSEQDFRRMVRDLMWDMARLDMAATTREKNPWENYVPPAPPTLDRFRYPQLQQPPYNSPSLKKREQSRGEDVEQPDSESDAVADGVHED